MLRHRSIAVLAAAAGLLASAGPAAAEQFVVDGPFTVKLGRCDAQLRGTEVRVWLENTLVSNYSLTAPPARQLELENTMISNLSSPQRKACGL